MNSTAPTSFSPHQALEILYRCHSREIWAMAYARWIDADLAMDLVQEAFFRLWKQMQSGREILHPQAWLLRVAGNLGADLCKSSFCRNGTQPDHVLQAIIKPERDPLEKMACEETRGQLRAELAKMSRLDREVLTLRYALDYKTRDIADRLEISPAAVNMRLSRARQRLVKQLSAQESTGHSFCANRSSPLRHP
jgi:RNA polymerase sigma-70 factor (ECF subfamily)